MDYPFLGRSLSLKPQNRSGHICLILLIAVLLFAFLIGCKNSAQQAYPYIYSNGKIEVGGDGEPIKLINNPDAINPTYKDLLDFIKTDKTDILYYIEEGDWAYVCADASEDVHNNAEAAGIKAAWVGIHFIGNQPGHAINAFETVDKGLVYIDCTGGRSFTTWDEAVYTIGNDNVTDQSSAGEPSSWDTIAYVKIAEEYGVIDIDAAESLSYDYYQDYKKRWEEYHRLLEDYNSDVEKYNQEIAGKVYRKGSIELAIIQALEQNLNEQAEQLDNLREGLSEYWYGMEGMHIVEEIQIHW
ncbi:hypothetical protein ACFLWM_00120 [Chloroflexota bacterium]